MVRPSSSSRRIRQRAGPFDAPDPFDSFPRCGAASFRGDHLDVDDLPAAAGAEAPRTGLEGEEGVVAATADVHAGVEVRAALADDDLAGLDDLAAEALDAEALGVGVAAVAGRRSALLVCHVVVSPS